MWHRDTPRAMLLEKQHQEISSTGCHKFSICVKQKNKQKTQNKKTVFANTVIWGMPVHQCKSFTQWYLPDGLLGTFNKDFWNYLDSVDKQNMHTKSIYTVYTKYTHNN